MLSPSGKTEAEDRVNDFPQTKTYIRERIRRSIKMFPDLYLSTADPIEISGSSA